MISLLVQVNLLEGDELLEALGVSDRQVFLLPVGQLPEREDVLPIVERVGWREPFFQFASDRTRAGFGTP